MARKLGTVDGIRAKRPARLPVVLTRSELQRLFARLDGVVLVVATLLYGAVLRLLECLRIVPAPEREEVVAELLRRVAVSDHGTPSDEEFTAAADQVFQALDRRENSGR